MVNEKGWMIVYLNISFFNVIREEITKKIDKAYNDGKLTYRQKKYGKISVLLTTEFINFVWQVYGNFIYYDKS